MIELTLPLPLELNPNKRHNYWKRAELVKQHRQRAWAEARVAVRNLESEATMPWKQSRVTYHFRHHRYMDWDNLIASCKSYQDGLVDAEIIYDDSPKYMRYGEHTFKLGKPSQLRIVIDNLEEQPERIPLGL